MFFKRTALALLLPLSLAAMVTLGCGGKDEVEPTPPAPQPSSEAGIANLEISLGTLAPVFNPAIKNYSATVGTMGESSVGVTITLKDAKAKLTVNGLATPSGAVTNFQLKEGDNKIVARVVAEDGRTDNSLTLNMRRLPFNTRVSVLNGLGGALVEGTKLRLTDSEGKELAKDVPLPKEKNGQVIFGLDPAQKYNIYAKGTGVGEACFANFDPAKEETAVLYCLRNSTTYYKLEAPEIQEIAFATANSVDADWKEMPNNAYYVGTAANMAAVRVTVLSSNPLFIPDVSEYLPVCLMLDEVASENMTGAEGVSGTAIKINEAVGNKYKSSFRFNVSSLLPANIFNKEHFLDVVAYDAIGNRTEQRVYLTLVDTGNTVIGDPDLTVAVPTITYSQSQVFVGFGDLPVRPGDPVSPDAMGTDPVGPYATSHLNTLRFTVRTPGNSAHHGIRGFEVWRSNGNTSNFVKIATRNYATLAAGTHTFTDHTPGLVEGKMFYRVRAFNGNPANQGYSLVSDPFEGFVLPPSTTGPAASHQVAQNKLWPTFKIAPSNPRMFAKDANGDFPLTDHFHFTLYVKNANNEFPFLMVPFWVDFTEANDDLDDEGENDNQKRLGFEYGMPTVVYLDDFEYDDDYPVIDGGDWIYATDVDANGVYTPFAYLDSDGSLVINTDSKGFQATMQNAVREAYKADVDPPYFMPGVAYHWNIFGDQGGVLADAAAWFPWFDDALAAWFAKGMNPPPYMGFDIAAAKAVSFGSSWYYGYGSPEGWFTIIIDADAK